MFPKKLDQLVCYRCQSCPLLPDQETFAEISDIRAVDVFFGEFFHGRCREQRGAVSQGQQIGQDREPGLGGDLRLKDTCLPQHLFLQLPQIDIVPAQQEDGVSRKGAEGRPAMSPKIREAVSCPIL